MNYGAAFALVLLMAAPGWSQPGKSMEPGPQSAQDSLKCFKTRPGFVVELMVAEPLVQSPIAFAWGPDGKFWVVEMGDYPSGTDGKGKFGGRVKLLTRSRADGPYDKAVVFLDGLGFPTGVTPYDKGVIVTCAPEIFYAEDTDGDGKADKKVVLYTGFAEGNQQHRVNGLVYGFDHWWYGANGDSGGKIRSARTGKEFDLGGRDFRLRPDDGAFDVQSGATQFGRARDDWGNWFGNSNSWPMYHYSLDDRYLRRNPHLVPPDPRVQVSVAPGAAPVYPVSKPLARFNNLAALNHFTSACSAIVYRDDLFGPEFAGNAFVSEPVHNLVHREIMSPVGATFSSRRADDEKKSEFLASTDNWFRPTTIQTGPDGALWVADMYRYVIEHPEWIPKEWQDKLDLRAGHELGRIYRVYPAGKKPRPIPVLDKLTPLELAGQLGSASGWTRDAAQQLLIRRKDPQSLAHLESLLKTSDRPLTRLHALATLQALTGGRRGDILRGLGDADPGVRRWGVQFGEALLGGDEEVLARVLVLAEDADPQVRLQVAYSLGQVPSSGRALAGMALKHRDDVLLLAAVVSSLHAKNFSDFFKSFPLTDTKAFPDFFLSTVYRMAGNQSDAGSVLASLCNLGLARDSSGSGYFLAVASILDAQAQRKIPVPHDAELIRALRNLTRKAREVVESPKAAVRDKIEAIGMLGRGLATEPGELELVAGFLKPQTPEHLHTAAVEAILRERGQNVGELLLRAWKGYSPKQRAMVLDALLSREEWTAQLLDQMEKKNVLPLEIDASRRQGVLEHRNEKIRKRAVQLFAEAIPRDRAQVLAAYRPVFTMQADADRGAKIFAKTCAGCHLYQGKGPPVGPDLASVKDKTLEGLLVAILDPNRAVEPRYINYRVVTKAGQTLGGLIANETSEGITLGGADGKKIKLRRSDIEELTSTSKSLMPDGLEKDISLPDMADLLAYLRGQGK